MIELLRIARAAQIGLVVRNEFVGALDDPFVAGFVAVALEDVTAAEGRHRVVIPPRHVPGDEIAEARTGLLDADIAVLGVVHDRRRGIARRIRRRARLVQAVDTHAGEDMSERRKVDAPADRAERVVVILAGVARIAPECRAGAHFDLVRRQVRDDVEARRDLRQPGADLARFRREQIVVVTLVDFGAREEEEVAEADAERIDLGSRAVGHGLADHRRLARLRRRFGAGRQWRYRHQRPDDLRPPERRHQAERGAAQSDQNIASHGGIPPRAKNPKN